MQPNIYKIISKFVGACAACSCCCCRSILRPPSPHLGTWRPLQPSIADTPVKPQRPPAIPILHPISPPYLHPPISSDPGHSPFLDSTIPRRRTKPRLPRPVTPCLTPQTGEDGSVDLLLQALQLLLRRCVVPAPQLSLPELSLTRSNRSLQRWPLRPCAGRQRARGRRRTPRLSRKCTRPTSTSVSSKPLAYTFAQRAETDFFSGDPLRALSTLVYSDNIDLQRSASLTFAEITERGPLLSLLVPPVVRLD